MRCSLFCFFCCCCCYCDLEMEISLCPPRSSDEYTTITAGGRTNVRIVPKQDNTYIIRLISYPARHCLISTSPCGFADVAVYGGHWFGTVNYVSPYFPSIYPTPIYTVFAFCHQSDGDIIVGK